MLQKVGYKSIVLLTLCAIIFSIIKPSFAWLGGSNEQDIDVYYGSIKINYFERGEGTESEPYIIHTPTHLSNLAWLQDLGMIPDGTHFKLCGNDSHCTINGHGIEGNVLEMGGHGYPTNRYNGASV